MCLLPSTPPKIPKSVSLVTIGLADILVVAFSMMDLGCITVSLGIFELNFLSWSLPIFLLFPRPTVVN